jgi:triacylglycerol lipase
VKPLAAGGSTEERNNLLKQVDVELIDALDEDQVQGHMCKALGAQYGGRYFYSFLVVAFRRSEKKVNDW